MVEQPWAAEPETAPVAASNGHDWVNAVDWTGGAEVAVPTASAPQVADEPEEGTETPFVVPDRAVEKLEESLRRVFN